MQRHRVLIVGVGSIGERHLRCFARTGRAGLSLCEINRDLRKQVAERYSVQQTFADVEAALDGLAASHPSGGAALTDPPQIAVVCTPADQHIPLAVRLAEAGVHLLIEKPLSTSLDGIDRLMQIVREKRLTAAVAYVLRINPLLTDMRREILSGRFGEPVQIIGVSGQHFPFYRPAYRETYYRNRATGGGAIQDALTHLLNAGEWLAGPVTELAADAGHLILNGVTVEDTVHVIARHGPVMGSYSLNQHQAPNETSLTVVCARGTVRCEFHRHRWLSATTPGDDWTVEREQPLERDDLFVAQAERFLDVVERISSPACSLDEGLQTLRTILAVPRAADTRTWQTL